MKNDEKLKKILSMFSYEHDLKVQCLKIASAVNSQSACLAEDSNNASLSKVLDDAKKLYKWVTA